MPIRPGNLLRHSCKDDMSSEISTEKSGKNNLTLDFDTRGAYKLQGILKIVKLFLFSHVSKSASSLINRYIIKTRISFI